MFTREVLDGLLRIGFLYHQQIIWNKGRTVLTRTHYWFQHEPCWYVRKKNAPWFGKAGENSTIWDSPSPKFIMGGSRRGEVRPSHAEARRSDAAPDPESHQARRIGLRAIPGQRHDAGRRGTHRARLLRHGAGSEVRGCDRAALADAVSGKQGQARGRRAHVRGDRGGTPEGGSSESLAAAGRSRTSKRNCAPGIRTWKGCAWRCRTGRRNCGYCRRAKAWPPLRHVWPTLAPPARTGSDGQGCRDGRTRRANIATRSRKARRGRSRAGRREGSGTTG